MLFSSTIPILLLHSLPSSLLFRSAGPGKTILLHRTQKKKKQRMKKLHQNTTQKHSHQQHVNEKVVQSVFSQWHTPHPLERSQTTHSLKQMQTFLHATSSTASLAKVEPSTLAHNFFQILLQLPAPNVFPHLLFPAQFSSAAVH